jgi:hypothetical protein
MDKLFGGNDAEADLALIAEIRCQLSLNTDVPKDDILKENECNDTAHIEAVIYTE